MLSFLTIIKKIKPATIRGQLIVGVTLVLLLLMTLFVFGLVEQQRKFLKKQNHEEAFGFVTRYSLNSGRYIIEHDFDELQRLTLTSLHLPYIRYAMILSPEGVVLAHTNSNFIGKVPTDAVSLQLKGSTETKTLIEDEHILDIASPIFVDKKMVGWARAGIGQEQIQNNLLLIVKDGLAYIAIALLIGAFCAIFIGNRLTAGLYKLTSVADKIKKGDRNIRAAPFKTGELLDLGTAFNQMLDEISASENLLSMVIENMPVGVWLLNEKGDIVSTNSTGNEIWSGAPQVGLSEYGLYKIWRTDTKELVAPENYPGARAVTKGETIINEELEMESFNGTHKIILNSALPLKDKEGKIIGAIAINVDITERKKITEQLALSESTFRSAFDSSAIGMAIVSPEGKFLRVNREFCRMVGYSEDELLLLTAQNITYPYNVEQNRIYREQTLDGTINNFKMDKKYIHKNGSIVWANLSASLVRDGQNKPLFFVTQIEDISESKKITEQLTLSESTFRSAFNSSAIGMALVSPDGKFLRVNRDLCRMFGYSEEELLSLTFQKITYPYNVEQNRIYLEQILDGTINNFRLEKKYIHKNGLPVWTHLSTSLVRDSENKPLFFVSQIEDISERKKTIDQLTLSESTFRSAFDYSAIGITLVSPEGKFLEVNKSLCGILGYTEKELLSLTFQDITHPDDLEEDLSHVKDVLDGMIDNYQMEKRYFHANGSIIWAQLNVSLVRDSQSKPLFFISQIEDITERKKISEQLALRESTLRGAFDYSAIGMGIVSPDGKFLRVNKALCRTLGYAEKELLSLNFQEITHPDDLEEDLKNVKNILDGRIDNFQMEKRYFHKNRTIIWADLNVSLVRDGQNQPLFLVSQVEDISERKKSEILIKESEEKFRKLVEETMVGVFILQGNRFVYVNPQFEKISGYTKTELVNKVSYKELIDIDDLEKIKRNNLPSIVEEKRSDHYTVKGIRKDGSSLQVEIIISPISYEGKAADIGTIIDVTEKFEEEKRINKAVTDAQENERQQISMELHDNVKQIMAATLLNIDFMKMIVKDDNNTAPVLNNIKNFIRDAIEELRRISHQLAPTVDASISLEEKIKTVIGTMNVSEAIEINYHFYKLEEAVKPDVQLAIYRIIQEQFTNILKHAQASLVDITVERRNGDICMSIEDNGVGFDTRKSKNGIGLENIKRRVQVLNGNFNILTFPGNGCTLYVELPVN